CGTTKRPYVEQLTRNPLRMPTHSSLYRCFISFLSDLVYRTPRKNQTAQDYSQLPGQEMRGDAGLPDIFLTRTRTRFDLVEGPRTPGCRIPACAGMTGV